MMIRINPLQYFRKCHTFQKNKFEFSSHDIEFIEIPDNLPFILRPPHHTMEIFINKTTFPGPFDDT